MICCCLDLEKASLFKYLHVPTITIFTILRNLPCQELSQVDQKMSVSKMSPLSILTTPLRLALFDPRVTAPLLVALLYYPEKLRELLPERFHALISSQAAIRTLSVLLGLSILRGVNGKLSQWTANNWKKDAKFVKSQELVLISGGTSGIGKLMAEDFAKKGVKVIILDLNLPKAALRKSWREPCV